MVPGWLVDLGRGIVPIRVPAFGLLEFLFLPIPLFLLARRGKSAGYLLSFSLFFVYMWAVLAHTVFYLLPTNADVLAGIQASRWSACIHLVPAFLSGEFDPRSEQVYGNFLLGVPFGFGLPFVVAEKHSTPRRVLAFGLGLAVTIEVAQLLIGLLLLHGPYRVIDVDDVWLVASGAALGYAALWASARLYRRLGWTNGARVPLWSHFHVVLLNVAAHRCPGRGARARRAAG